jgi:hypothetical protein
VVLLTRREADVTGGRHQSEAGPPKSLPGVAGFKSERWPTSNRNVDRLQAGRVADIKSERVAGLRRNLQARKRIAQLLRKFEAIGVSPGSARILDLLPASRHLGYIPRKGAVRAPEIHLGRPAYPGPARSRAPSCKGVFETSPSFQ